LTLLTRPVYGSIPLYCVNQSLQATASVAQPTSRHYSLGSIFRNRMRASAQIRPWLVCVLRLTVFAHEAKHVSQGSNRQAFWAHSFLISNLKCMVSRSSRPNHIRMACAGLLDRARLMQGVPTVFFWRLPIPLRFLSGNSFPTISLADKGWRSALLEKFCQLWMRASGGSTNRPDVNFKCPPAPVTSLNGKMTLGCSSLFKPLPPDHIGYALFCIQD